VREREGGASVVLHPAGEIVAFGAFRFDRANRLLSRDGAELPLPPRVLGVLEYLVARPSHVVSKQALMDAVWKDASVTETSLTEAVSQLRQVLGDDPQQPAYVQTVHRRGYRFVASVTLDGAAASPLRRADRPALASSEASEVLGPPRLAAVLFAKARTWVLLAIAAATGAFAAWAILRSTSTPVLPVTRATIPIAIGDPNTLKEPPALAVAPDGSKIFYALARNGRSQIYERALDRNDSVALAGTEGGTQPFVSPDGEWIAFFADGKLKKVPTRGGAVASLCEARYPMGGSWGDDGTIVFAADLGGLSRVSSQGGTPELLTHPDPAVGELAHWWPEVLPGGDAVVFTVWPTAGLEEARLAIAPVHTKNAMPRLLVKGASYGRYSPTRHLVFTRRSRLMAVGFDSRRGEVRGEPVALFDGVSVDWCTGAAEFSFSRTGTLAYVAGTHEVPAHTLVLFDADGRERALPTPTRPFMNLDPAPDGRRVAVTIHEGIGSDVWVADVSRGELTRLTFEAHNIEPTFTPDGKRVTFASSRTGPFNLFWVPADGTGAPERLLESAQSQYPDSWSPDGRTLAFTTLTRETGADIWMLSMDSRQARPFLRTSFDEEASAFSPDGRFLAYASNETNRWEVFVRPFPAGGPKHSISSNGGHSPSWSADGRELYFRDDEGLWSVPIETVPTFRAGAPRRRITDRRIEAAAPLGAGRDILIVRRTDQAPAGQVSLVLGWFGELERLASRRDVPGSTGLPATQ
jgi:eukaryotic-like serine/threonine-protein kinase